MDKVIKELQGIKKELAAITSLLRRLPEIQAATLLLMQEEQQKAALQGRRASELWTIPDPDQR